MLPGMLYFVSIHMVPLVPRGPVGKVYGDVIEAFYVDLTLKVKRMGKGLTLLRAQKTATLRLQKSTLPCPTVAQVGLTKSSIAIL